MEKIKIGKGFLIRAMQNGGFGTAEIFHMKQALISCNFDNIDFVNDAFSDDFCKAEKNQLLINAIDDLIKLDKEKEIIISFNSNRENIKIKGHRGTWYIVDMMTFKGEIIYLLEHEEYGDEVPNLIVWKNGKILIEDSYNGFDDLNDL